MYGSRLVTSPGRNGSLRLPTHIEDTVVVLRLLQFGAPTINADPIEVQGKVTARALLATEQDAIPRCELPGDHMQ